MKVEIDHDKYVQINDPNRPGGYLVIAKAEFDHEKHTLFGVEPKAEGFSKTAEVADPTNLDQPKLRRVK